MKVESERKLEEQKDYFEKKLEEKENYFENKIEGMKV